MMDGGLQALLIVRSSAGFHALAAASAFGLIFRPPYSPRGYSTGPVSSSTTVPEGSSSISVLSRGMRTERSQKPEKLGCPPGAAWASAPKSGATSSATERIGSIRPTRILGRCALPLFLVRVERLADNLSIFANHLQHAQIARAAARRPALHRDVLTRLEAVARPTTPNQDGGRVGLGGPDLDAAILGRDVEADETVWIAETELRHDAVDRDRPVCLEE